MRDRPPRALHDPVLCLAPALFQSLVRGQRNQPLHVDYKYGMDLYAFRGQALLGCDDLRVLQGIVSLASEARRMIGAGSSASALKLRADLHLTGFMAKEDVVLVDASLASIARAAGYGANRGGAMGGLLRASLGRLASVAVEVETVAGLGGWRLISWDEEGTGRARLRIALNPRLSLCARAIPRFVQIEMGEARRLNGDLARLLHQRLSGWINAAGSRETSGERYVFVATLMDYAWGLPAEGAAMRQRRSSLKSALAELEAVGWTIRKVQDRDGLLEITRPSSQNVLRTQKSSTGPKDGHGIFHEATTEQGSAARRSRRPRMTPRPSGAP